MEQVSQISNNTIGGRGNEPRLCSDCLEDRVMRFDRSAVSGMSLLCEQFRTVRNDCNSQGRASVVSESGLAPERVICSSDSGWESGKA